MLDFNAKTVHGNDDYDTFRHRCLSCDACDLSQTRTQVVVGTGPVPCPLMIIGEGPGEQEDLKGEPFVGKAGALLSKILDSVGIDREKEVYITNTVKCRPPNNRTPLNTEIERCLAHLQYQIQTVQPKILILLGSPALKTVLGSSYTITKSRGKWFKAQVNYMQDPLYIIPLFHPAYLLRNASKEVGQPKWLTWQDMKEVKAALSFYSSPQTT